MNTSTQFHTNNFLSVSLLVSVLGSVNSALMVLVEVNSQLRLCITHCLFTGNQSG